MKLLAAFALVSFAAAGNSGRAPDVEKAARSPILVELFTSEGCSSCPPADELLRKLDAAQPVSGAQLIVLSEHVDYWNHDGWKDPYSASWLTERQSAYCRALRVDEPYTPQMIVDGTALVKMSDAEQMRHVFETAAAAPKASVTIGSVKIEGSTVRGRVQANGGSGESADVYVAVALDHAESQVLRGENKGRHLTHIAVVESVKKLGTLQKAAGFDQEFQIKLKGATDAGNLRIVAFAQEPNEGKVVGAALERPPMQTATPN